MQNSPPINPATAVVVFPLFFVTLWCAIGLVLSRVSGWSLLARRFRTDSRFGGRTWKWQSARMRWSCNYNNCLTFGSGVGPVYVHHLSVEAGVAAVAHPLGRDNGVEAAENTLLSICRV